MKSIGARLLIAHDCASAVSFDHARAGAAGAERRSRFSITAHTSLRFWRSGRRWEKRVLGVSFDGTGYGDDGTIWGGEIFAGSIAEGFERVAHLRTAALPGGDAAARYPGSGCRRVPRANSGLPDLSGDPFRFPERYQRSLELIRKDVRMFETTSMGRLFDTAAALLGFTREASFEGQAAIWVEHLASSRDRCGAVSISDERGRTGFCAAARSARLGPLPRPRRFGMRGRISPRHRARPHAAVTKLAEERSLDTMVLSGGVFQNELLLEQLKIYFAGEPARNLDQSRSAAERRRHQPGAGGISGLCITCMNSRSR